MIKLRVCIMDDVIKVNKGLYPILPLRDIVVYPNMVVPLFVGREKSVKALEVVMSEDKEILLSSQIDATDDDPSSEGIYQVGVLAMSCNF